MDLNPIGEPSSPGDRWCPSCQGWFASWQHQGRRRCECCGTALVRPMKADPPTRPRPFELRPGVIAEFADPRDRYDPSRELAELRASDSRYGWYEALGK